MNLYVKTDASKSVADNWVEVLNLNEFRLDGIVLSDDQPGVNHGARATSRAAVQHLGAGADAGEQWLRDRAGPAMLSRLKPTMSAPPI